MPLVILAAGLKAQSPVTPQPLQQSNVILDKDNAAADAIKRDVLLSDGGAADRLDRFGDALPAGAVVRLGTVRLRHAEMVEGVAFWPDGQTLASCGLDRWIRCWDVATGRLSARFRSPDNSWVFSVAFSPDGSKLICGGEHGLVSMWKLASGELISSTKGHKDRVYAVAFSPDDSVFASAGDDGRVCVWDADHRQAGSGTGNARTAWDRQLSGRVFTRRNSAGICKRRRLAVCLEPDPRQRAGRNRHSAQAGRCEFGIQAPMGSNYFGEVPVTSQRGRAVTVVGEIHVWSSDDGTPQPAFRTDEQLPGGSMLAVSADRSTLVSAHSDRIVVWDVASRQPRRIIRSVRDNFGPRTHGLAVSPDGKIVASKSGNMGEHKIYLWDATTGEPLLTQEETHGASVLGSAYSPDGKFIATGSADDSVRLWNAAAGEYMRKIDQGTGWVR